LHRSGEYATPTVAGRSHATEHHYIAERFFGRSANRHRKRDGIFEVCPWGYERKDGVYCYECYEELLHNSALLPHVFSAFSRLVLARGLNEDGKPEDKSKIAGRIMLLQEVMSVGLKTLLATANFPEPKPD
jgi:hypothetical protein